MEMAEGWDVGHVGLWGGYIGQAMGVDGGHIWDGVGAYGAECMLGYREVLCGREWEHIEQRVLSYRGSMGWLWGRVWVWCVWL